MRGLTRIGLLAWTAALAACGSSPPPAPATYYDNNTLQAPALNSKAHLARYRKAAADTVKKRSITYIPPGERGRRLGAKDVNGLPLAVLAAIHQIPQMPKGSERDVLLNVDKSRRPVSLRVDRKGAAYVATGPAWHPDRAPHSTRDVKALMRKTWEKGMASDLALAWAKVPAAERALLKGVTFHRVRGKRGSEGGKYIANENGHRIEIYDRAADARGRNFAGSATAPMPRSALTVFHEVGHGISSHPKLEAVRRYNRTVKSANSGPRRAEAKQRLKALGAAVKALEKRNPVLAAFSKVLGKSGAVTLYGQTSAEESFAEAFALYRGDPEALKRLRPKVFDWFQAQGHLKAVQAAVSKLPAAI